MEQQLPSWLVAVIAAAGMTAYAAEGLDRKVSKPRSATPAEPLDESTPPLH